MAENSIKPLAIVNKEIETEEEDLIGVEAHIATIKDAINNGAEVISLSSSYGGGKSSVCKLLSKDELFYKTSTISLWDVAIDKQIIDANAKDGNGKISKAESRLNIIDLYKSFLFQLSSDFYDEKYSRYISKALNKSTTFFNIFLKNKIAKVLFVLTMFFLGIYLLCFGLEFNWDLISNEKVKLIITNKTIQYFALSLAGISLLLLIFKCKIVYTSWKSEKERLITNDDVTTLYTSIINDSIPFYRQTKIYQEVHLNCGSKSLVIIEDVDRCVDDKSLDTKLLMNFLKSLIKLKHYNCKNRFLNKKLKSIIFIIALDEKKLYDSEDKESILKLFDYRLDLGNIHNEDYVGILNELLKSFDNLDLEDINKDDFKIILRNKSNSLRLLKNIINDAMLKYNVLKNRFQKSNNIKLKACIAYSYLKNTFYLDFNNFISDGSTAVLIIQNNLDAYYQNKPLPLDGFKDDNFKKELAFLIKTGYIDDYFKLYFYNYPKIEHCPTLQEAVLKDYLLGKEELNVSSNKKVSREYIKKMQGYINSLKLGYPNNLLDDSYLSNILFESESDSCLIALLTSKLNLDTEKNISVAIETIRTIIHNQIDRESALPYFIESTKVIWSSEKKFNYSCESFYVFRKILFSYLQDDIIEFKQLFNSPINPLSKEEFAFLENKKSAMSLINDNFHKDLEDIFPNLFTYCNSTENLKYALFWSKNVSNENKFILYAKDVLLSLNTLDLKLLSAMKPYLGLLFTDDDLNKWINCKIKELTKEVLKEFNELHLILNLDKESEDIMTSNGLGMTPLITLLYSKQFNDIRNSSFEYKTRFGNFLKSSEYIDESIYEFQQYYLSLPSENKFDDIFENKFLAKYPISVDWKNVNNIHLVIAKNLNNKENIILNLNNKVLFNKEKIQLTLLELCSLTNSYFNIICDCLMQLFQTYPKEVAECNELCQVDIIKTILAQPEEYAAKLAIKYQIVIQKVIEEFFDVITSCKSEEDNIIYAEFINAQSSTPSIDVLDSINVDYPFNRDIIAEFYTAKRFSKVIKSSILSKDNYYLKSAIEQIPIRNLLGIYQEKEIFKNALLKNHEFLSKMKENQLAKEISDSDIISIINQDFSMNLVKFVVSALDDERIIRILNGIEHINDNQVSSFIEIIKLKSDIIVNSKDTYEHLWNIIPANYRGVFTKKINQKIPVKII